MRVLVVQQDHVSPVGPVGEAFARRGWDVEELLVVPAERFADPSVEPAFPDPAGYDALVPMGAPWSVYEAAIGRWLPAELDMLRAADAAGVPVLGICFGGQALAAALGGAVERAPEAEVGWYDLTTDDPSLVEAGPWFQWHHDRWRLPPGAVEVARTPRASQAFVLRRNLAVQFHPELTAGQLQGWVDNGGAGYLAAHGVDAATLLAGTRAEEPAAAARADRLVGRFLTRVASGPVPSGSTSA